MRAFLATIALTAMLAGCSAEIGLPAYTDKGVRYPIALAAEPSGRWLYAIGANFDRQYRSGILRVLDTNTNTFNDNLRLEVPNYAAGLWHEPVAKPTVDGPSSHLYVTTRDDDAIAVYDIRDHGVAPPSLDCGQPSGQIGPCAKGHLIGGDKAVDLDIGDDPVALSIHPSPDRSSSLLHVAAASDGQVSLLELASNANDGAHKEAQLLDSTELGAGLSAVLTSPVTGRTYVADTRLHKLHNHTLVAMQDSKTGVRTGYKIEQHAAVALPQATGTEFSRDMTLSLDGSRLYIAYRSPNAMLIVDIAPTAKGDPANKLVGVVGIGGRPASVVVAPTGPGGQERAYIACFGTDDIWVVDPALRTVVDTIRLPHSPYALVPVQVPDADGGASRWRLYAGLFSKHEVAVLDIDPDSPNPHKQLAMVR